MNKLLSLKSFSYLESICIIIIGNAWNDTILLQIPKYGRQWTQSVQSHTRLFFMTFEKKIDR